MVVVNGENREIAHESTIELLLESLNLKPERVAVELNGNVIRRNSWSSTVLSDGDRLEIIHFVGGGSSGRIAFLFPFPTV